MTNYLERKEEILAKVKHWGTPYEEIISHVEALKAKRPVGGNAFDNEAGILEQIDKCVKPEEGGNMIFFMKNKENPETVKLEKFEYLNLSFSIERAFIFLH